MKKISKVLSVVGIIILAALAVYYVYNAENRTLMEQLQGMKTFRNEDFEFKYPDDVFSERILTNGVMLESNMSYTYNFSGLEGHETTHVFAIEFIKHDDSILPVIKNTSEFAFNEMFPDGTIASYQDNKGFFSKIEIGEESGYTYVEGAEGLNSQVVFLPVSNAETLVVIFNYLGDNLNPPISEAEQKKFFQTIMSSVKSVE